MTAAGRARTDGFCAGASGWRRRSQGWRPLTRHGRRRSHLLSRPSVVRFGIAHLNDRNGGNRRGDTMRPWFGRRLLGLGIVERQIIAFGGFVALFVGPLEEPRKNTHLLSR